MHPKGPQNNSFEGSRGSPPEVAIPLIGALIWPVTIITINN